MVTIISNICLHKNDHFVVIVSTGIFIINTNMFAIAYYDTIKENMFADYILHLS